nr:MAG TPA: DNA polymerase II small subunit [Herelleviridae sp.]
MNYLNKVKIATQNLDDKVIGYQDWAEIVLGPDYRDVYSSEYIRRSAKVFSIFLKNAEEANKSESTDELQDILEAKEQLIKERKKLQAVNVQAQEYYRTAGRNELLVEQIKESIASLEPVKVKNIIHVNPAEKVGVLVIADVHYDSNYTMQGLFGETVNAYNKDVFKTRMWNLLAKIDADDIDIDKLKVVFCGDDLEGLIRASSLVKLRQPVVKSAIEFAEFISQWLVAVKDRLGVPIDVAIVPGNHTICRYLSQKPEFPEENLEYIIHAFVDLRLKDCDDIKVEPYDDVYFTTVFNENLIFAHGETKDLESLMRYFEDLYNVTIDACYGAHYHSESSKAVGIGNVGSKRVIRVPSMIGLDPYAKSIQKNNRAGAYFACFDEDGECFNKIYYLN